MKSKLTRLGCTIFCLIIAAASIATGKPKSFDVWREKDTLPPFDQIVFLPIFLPNEEPGFVDLGGLSVTSGGVEWKALQFTRDKQFDVTVPVGKYLFGLVGDEWPPATVDPLEELWATRLISIEIDGTKITVNHHDLTDLSSAEGSAAIFNVFPRFLTPGNYTLKYTWIQHRPFFFVYPYEVIGIPDPSPAFEGRRVFVPETVGDTLDGKMVLSYNVTVIE
jgi:hypothetical protein